EHLKKPGPRLYRRYRDGEVVYPGYLDDYTNFVWGLIELYEATFEVSYLEEALGLNHVMIDLFWDETHGGFFYSGKDNEVLIKQSKEIYDGAIPSSNSVAALNLVRLGHITGDRDLVNRAEQLTGTFAKRIKAYPSAYTQFLAALDFMIGPIREIVIVENKNGGSSRAMIETIHAHFLPNEVLLLRPSGQAGEEITAVAPFVKELQSADDQPVVYICENHSCRQNPITEVEPLKAALA
ncbi:MAG: thioredoxin domain-containing protein, partial [Syntrophobacteria bacterium]